jgi:hypothetical protein
VDAAGADVVGLDSQGRLELNLMKTMDAASALAYDQYTLININPEGVNPMERLVGKAGNYYAGSFRLYDPCDWGPFQVEVHEPDGKKRVTLQNGMMSETVSCVPPAIADPTEFSVTVHTGIHGLATVRWAAIPGSVRYHVAALDTTNPNMWTVAGYEIVDGGATREVRFTGLMSGTTYLFVTIGEQANGTYSIPRSLLQTTVYR